MLIIIIALLLICHIYVLVLERDREEKTYRDSLSIAKLYNSLELPINACSGDGEYPRSHILHRRQIRPVVPRRARGQNPFPHCMESSNGDGVAEIVPGGSPDGDGYEIDAVGDGVVEARQDVDVGAGDAPAHLVRGDARRRHAASGRPLGEAVEVGILDGRAGDRGGGVSAVAFVVHRTWLFLPSCSV